MTSQYKQEKLDHTPWVEKYRPKNLDDVASQDHAVKVLKKTLQLANLPHMLFYGPPGTGKTSTVLALAKQLYGPRLYKLRVLELNASDERGISIVRLKIKNFARLSVSNPTTEDLANYPCPPYKIIVLDEADSMTNDAQAALRRTMENYSGVTRFCLICNYITRIIDPLALRCLKFRIRLLDSVNALARLSHVADLEHVRVALAEVYDELISVSNGDLRKAITYLQSAARLDSSLQSENFGLSNGITVDSVREIAGVVDQSLMSSLVTVIKLKDTAKLASAVHQVVLLGWSAQQVSDQLHDILILDDTLSSAQKNEVATALFDTDRRLNNGTDEHIQLLNLMLLISKAM
ncbi:P-loop containing nucleoside triphosphate hydrolase protein [Metschnikowia bicuspidata var. bicuspidata NRRL YB-4993]|uniref:Replication factor C subunit 2 n=1 Tax=Metschnikowia bicuspidata var. bicuspidata NRRL YB-4993 TaxID=869754 RepID=A0A1A0HAT2_9ASCO|nr:P-loop containing nucleoside triphosphate hydrolase protein [Metschnikowia bicuspidata var. bicuspidata NRRL YB-4993]OBA21229.1 P-loop containing nucleoside triphosphate hydrolase protein [Metschnikowia bicuspidata var. bicuspidata NRRL YB-4993]